MLYVRPELVEDFDTWMNVSFYDKETGKFVDSITISTPHRNTERGIREAIQYYKNTHPDVEIEPFRK